MELKRLWSVVRRRLWLILLPAIVAFLVSLPSLPAAIAPSVGYKVTVRFTASQVVSPKATPGTYQDQAYIPWLASEYAATNLAAWMRTESFARETNSVLTSKGKTFDVDAIRGAISSDSARSIMMLEVTWPDDKEASQIAEAATSVLQNLNQTYFPQFGTDGAAVKVLDIPPIVTPVPPALATRMGPLFRVLIGLLAGIGLAFLVEYLDPTLRSRQEVESLGLPVIAEIPRHR